MLLGFLLMGSSLAGAADTLRIRVLEKEQPQRFDLYVEEGDLLIFTGLDDQPFQRLAANSRVSVSIKGEDLLLNVEGLLIRALSLRFLSKNEHPLFLNVHTKQNAPLQRSYAGELLVAIDATQPSVLKLINTVGLESYVASVVTSEYGLKDLEGSKAMAVVARTYALQALNSADTDYDHVDHTLSQVYRGAGRISEQARRAAQETRGEVLTARGALIEAVYYSSSGGHTADNESVWQGAPLAYLRGKPDPYDGASPHKAWKSSVPRARLLSALSHQAGFTVKGFQIDRRGKDGRVETVALLDTRGPHQTLSGNAFRLVVIRTFGAASLKSAMFSASLKGDKYIFQGNGYGHGVGLSQWGAHEMARRGFSYREILDFYYSDVHLEKQGASPTLAETSPVPQPPVQQAQQPIRPAIEREEEIEPVSPSESADEAVVENVTLPNVVAAPPRNRIMLPVNGAFSRPAVATQEADKIVLSDSTQTILPASWTKKKPRPKQARRIGW